MRIIGLLLIISGIVGLGFIFWPTVKLELEYDPRKKIEQNIIPVDSTLGIVIPEIGANSSIIPNVDPFDSLAYQQALTKGVAHAKGTVLPGDRGNSFLFSHSSVDFYRATQYNSVFYLLSKLEAGDPILIYRDGREMRFQVTQTRIVAGTNIEYLSTKTDAPTLTLMTCWPPGTSLKRLVVTAELF